MRINRGIRQSSRQIKNNIDVCGDNNRDNVHVDHRDDDEDDTNQKQRNLLVDSIPSDANTGTVPKQISNATVVPKLRSMSPVPKYEASAPYYDVLLYTYEPDSDMRSRIDVEKTTTKSISPIIAVADKNRNCKTVQRESKKGKNDEHIVTTTNFSARTKSLREKIQQSETTSLLINDNDHIGDGDQSPIMLSDLTVASNTSNDNITYSTTHEFYLDLFTSGGDFDDYIRKPSTNRNVSNKEKSDISTARSHYQALSKFADHCVAGRYEKVKQILEKNSMQNGGSWNAMVRLLETRETILHMSPLLLVFCMIRKIGIVITGYNRKSDVASNRSKVNDLEHHEDTQVWMKHIDRLEQRLIQVVIELLHYGASPLAKDICGRTVCFYGASTYATSRSLYATSMCINAAISSHIFGLEVIVLGLDLPRKTKTASNSNYCKDNCGMSDKQAISNGMHGLAGGYQAATGRRFVYLFGHKEEVAVLNRNIFLAQNNHVLTTSSSDPTAMFNLCNQQDRLGHTCLTELLGTKRVDVIKYILEKHGASIDIPDQSGKTIRLQSFSILYNLQSKSKVLLDDETTTALTVANYAIKCARIEQKEIDHTCTGCKSVLATNQKQSLNVCQQCMSVRYCSEKCQTDHWNDGGHKTECSKLRKRYYESILIDKSFIASSCVQFHKIASFQKPAYVEYDNVFTVKVELYDQSLENGIPILHIYDKSFACNFEMQVGKSLNPNDPIIKLVEQVQTDFVTAGRALHLDASFDQSGQLKVFIHRRKRRIW